MLWNKGNKDIRTCKNCLPFKKKSPDAQHYSPPTLKILKGDGLKREYSNMIFTKVSKLLRTYSLFSDTKSV